MKISDSERTTVMSTYRLALSVLLVFLLGACTSQTVTPAGSSIPLTASMVSKIPLANATQTGATTTRDKVGLILGNLLILSLYSFPMSYAENWAFVDPKKARKQAKKELSESVTATETPGDEAPATEDDWTRLAERLPRWVQKLPRVTAGLTVGGLLMIVVVFVGAVAFALYYHFSGQPEMVSQVIPRFAYWFPFALLGMVTDIPFMICYWEETRLRVLLRLVIWWFPRIIIIAFVINLPILQDLDLAATALTMLAIDVVLAAFCLGLYTAREQMVIKGVQ